MLRTNLMFRINLLILTIVLPSLGWATCGSDMESDGFSHAPVIAPRVSGNVSVSVDRRPYSVSSHRKSTEIGKIEFSEPSRKLLNDSHTTEHTSSKGYSSSSTEGCVEEVLVQGKALDTGSGFILFVSSMGRGFFHSSTISEPGSGQYPAPDEDDRLDEVPPHETDTEVNCSTDSETRWQFVNAAWVRDQLLGQNPASPTFLYRMWQAQDEYFRFEYPGGDVEVWRVIAPTNYDTPVENAPVPGSCIGG